MPKSLANLIRDMAAGGGASGGNSMNATFQISTMDGPSLLKFMNQKARTFVQAMKKMNNRFMST